jgi:serine protease Do
MRASPALLALALACTLAPGPSLAAERPSAALNLARQLNEAFVEVAEQASAFTVVIKVAQKADAGESKNHPFMERLPEEYRRQFEEYLEQEQQRRERFGPQFNGEGSGIVFREDGYILTNSHVVEDAEKIRVKLHDGREYDAVVRGADPDSDVAVIQLKGGVKGLPVARFADSSKVRVGEFAVAVGAPYELEYSVTFGHISAKGRAGLSNSLMDEDFLQTDANINPGNSGGPLVNLNAEVIGINSMIRGVGTGICFAIPSNLAREIANELIKEGRFRRSWLGVNIATLQESQELQARYPDVKQGVVVTHIVEDGPSANSELRRYDVITAVEGRKVATVPELRGLITRKRPGKEVALSVVRDGKTQSIRVTPGAMPDPEQRALASQPRRRNPAREPASPKPTPSPTPDPAPAPATPAEAAAPEVAAGETPPTASALGVTVRPLNASLAATFGLQADHRGVVVTIADRESALGRQGVRAGDLIYEIDGQAVKNAGEFTHALKLAEAKSAFVVRYHRGTEKGEVKVERP